jgi:hypothetical protein
VLIFIAFLFLAHYYPPGVLGPHNNGLLKMIVIDCWFNLLQVSYKPVILIFCGDKYVFIAHISSSVDIHV